MIRSRSFPIRPWCHPSKRFASSSVSNDDQDPSSSPLVKLYQYSICPFCHRAKALLGYSGTSYQAIEVDPLTRKEIKWSKDYKKVPVATIDDKPYFGSDKIIAGLLAEPTVRERLQVRWEKKTNGNNNGNNMSLDNFAQYDSKWVSFANDELAPLLYPNMCRTWSDAYVAFGYVNQVKEFGTLQRLAIRSIGSLAMYVAAGKVKKKRNITDERKALHAALLHLEIEGLRANNDFLSNAVEPDLGDLAVYGALRAIEGLPAHRDAVHNRGGPIPAWYDRMKESVERQ